MRSDGREQMESKKQKVKQQCPAQCTVQAVFHCVAICARDSECKCCSYTLKKGALIN